MYSFDRMDTIIAIKISILCIFGYRCRHNFLSIIGNPFSEEEKTWKK